MTKQLIGLFSAKGKNKEVLVNQIWKNCESFQRLQPAPYRTAESVSPKHPDKICDQISDALLDAYLSKDPDARVAIDVAGGHGYVFVTGELSSTAAHIDLQSIVHRLAGNVKIIEHIEKQSPEISRGVDRGGAGDQGIMVGYATSATPEHLPLEVVLARKLNQHIYATWRFDGKTQITLRNDKVLSVVASFQSTPQNELQDLVLQWLDNEPLVQKSKDVTLHINPSGDWHIGGFDADAGLTGRKLIVDNYGPRIPVGGGAFSGKDPSKVDRSAAYMARKIALDYLKKEAANEVYVYLAYAIGYDQPLEATVIIDGQEKQISGYDLSPRGIISLLDLKRPMYEETSRWGHFGNSQFRWEK
jgi:S-adenosylmethionine synthetase